MTKRASPQATSSLPILPTDVVVEVIIESEEAPVEEPVEVPEAPPSPLPSISKDDQIRTEGNRTESES